MKNVRMTICLVTAVLFMAAGQGFGWTYFNDGGTHNVNYSIGDNVQVQNGASGMPTTLNLLNGGSIGGVRLVALEDSRINIYDGSVSRIAAGDNSQVTMSGGVVSGALQAFDGGHITIVGSSFAVDGSPVGFGQYFASDFVGGNGVLTGTLDSGALLNNSFYISTDASITLVPEPATLFLLTFGGLALRRKK